MLPFFNFVTAITLLVCSPVTASAQVEEATDAGEDVTSVVVYDSEFFATYNPISAEDMIKRIPGTEGLLAGFGGGGDERRGLRSNTDQILINGKRLTGKENQSSQFLEKLPAKSVERIELITGNVRELDTDVGERVINVILKDDASTGSGIAQAGPFVFRGGEVRPMGNISYSGSAGNFSYTGSFQLRPANQPVDVVDVIITEGGNRLSVIEETREQNQDQYTARTTLTYDRTTGQTLQVNGFYRYFPRNNEDTTMTLLDLGNGPLISAGTIVDQVKGDDHAWEISGDYTQAIGNNAKFTGLFVYARETQDRDNENFAVFGEDFDQLGGDAKDQTAKEKILRGTFDWNLAQRHKLELGIEGAINILDKNLDFFQIVDGVRVGIPVINSDQKITEDRVEAFTTHDWTPVAGLEIETGLAAEFSWLTQLGSDVGTERSFQFVKPSFAAWYNHDDATQFWFSFRRDVGQLNFDDFVATVNREDDEILAGNPSLAPEKSWDFELGVERRFTGGAGIFSGRLFYRRINDVKDLIPLGALDSQPGNLGSGNHYGADIETSIRFGRFTPVDAVLSTTFLWQDSEVTDPFTGVKRRIGNQPEFELSIEGRHDIKSWGLSYGFDIDKDGPALESDFNEFDRKRTGLHVRLFMEKTIREGTILRAFWANVTEKKDSRRRTQFATTQAAGAIGSVVVRKERHFSVYGFRLRTTF